MPRIFFATDPESQKRTDVGSRLRTAREAKQLSIREIAATTKISAGSLEALEENDFSQLPGGIFTLAFVRSYAAEVGLDPKETASEFMSQLPGRESAEEDNSDTRFGVRGVFQSQQRMAETVVKLVLVGVPVAGLLLFFGGREAPVEQEVPVAARQVDPPIRVESPIVVEPVPLGPLNLVLRPRDDCWVSLTIDGESVFSRVMNAGERESYEADDVIILNIGDAGAFAFGINQQIGRSLGASGEVVTARITQENYRSYVAP